jgi:hypothetical protein
MTKLSGALNIKPELRIKTFEFSNHTFKVKVPLNKELEEMTSRIVDIPADVLDARLKKMTDAFTETAVEGVEVRDGEVFVDGRSTKETVTAVLQMERKIVEYIKLLVPENGNLDDLTYEDVEAEFPLQVQFALVEKIGEVIQPGYKDAKKN